MILRPIIIAARGWNSIEANYSKLKIYVLLDSRGGEKTQSKSERRNNPRYIQEMSGGHSCQTHTFVRERSKIPKKRNEERFNQKAEE